MGVLTIDRTVRTEPEATFIGDRDGLTWRYVLRNNVIYLTGDRVEGQWMPMLGNFDPPADATTDEAYLRMVAEPFWEKA